MDNHSGKLNDEAFQKGLQNWTAHPDWPQDFHSQLYIELNQLLKNGVTPSIWKRLVDVLWDWRAIQPKTKQFILERGFILLPEINQYVANISPGHQHNLSITEATWPEIASLFHIIKRIKGTSSPIFACTLCHLLLPDTFPLIDDNYIGVYSEYRDYWKFCKKLWENADEELKRDLKAQLGEYIPPENRSVFPWATKIVEICLSGS
jgi:hypothetical protein